MEKCWSWDFTVGLGDHLDPPKLLSKSTWLIGKIKKKFFSWTKKPSKRTSVHKPALRTILRAGFCPEDKSWRKISESLMNFRENFSVKIHEISEIFLKLLSSGQKPALRIVLRAGLWTEALFEGFFVQEIFFF